MNEEYFVRKLPDGRTLVYTKKGCSDCGKKRTTANTIIRRNNPKKNKWYFSPVCKSCASKRTLERAEKNRKETAIRQVIRNHLNEMNAENMVRKKKIINKNLNKLFKLVWDINK